MLFDNELIAFFEKDPIFSSNDVGLRGEKMRVTYKVAIMLLMLLYSGINAFPAFGSALKCGARLITEGDAKSKMLDVCGEPQNIELWEEERLYRNRHWTGYNYYQHDDEKFLKPHFIKKHVLVEEWTYNHGPHRFMDHIRLENGRIKEIISGKYGH